MSHMLYHGGVYFNATTTARSYVITLIFLCHTPSSPFKGHLVPDLNSSALSSSYFYLLPYLHNLKLVIHLAVLSIFRNIQRRMAGWLRSDEFKRMWKKLIVTYSRYYFDIRLEELRRSTTNRNQGSRCVGWQSHCIIPDFKAEANLPSPYTHMSRAPKYIGPIIIILITIILTASVV
jgi:hypothetical protein